MALNISMIIIHPVVARRCAAAGAAAQPAELADVTIK